MFFQSEKLSLDRLDKIHTDLNIPVPDPLIISNDDGVDGVSNEKRTFPVYVILPEFEAVYFFTNSKKIIT